MRSTSLAEYRESTTPSERFGEPLKLAPHLAEPWSNLGVLLARIDPHDHEAIRRIEVGPSSFGLIFLRRRSICPPYHAARQLRRGLAPLP